MIDLVKSLELGLDKLDSEEWDTDKIHVSDLAVALEGDDGKCARQLWLRLHNADRRLFTAGQKLMFQQGNNLHELAVELIREGLPEDYRVIGVEQPVEIQGITGRYDLMLAYWHNDYSNDHTNIIVDFKTLRGNAFNYLTEPKPSNKLQVRTYIMAKDADYGLLCYIDREGQNFARQFEVERNDEAVQKAINRTKELVKGEVPPPTLKPQIKTRENKTNTALYIKEPWQCSYCQYRDVSCEGALPEKFRKVTTVIGHKKEKEIKMKKGYEKLEDIVKEVI